MRTGLLFGSFNPIHTGHILVAGYMKEFAGMDRVWFIVSPRNPFKLHNRLASPAARLQMVKLAVKGYDRFSASDIEFGMPVPSYTIDTLVRLTADFPGNDFSVIIGSDNLAGIGKWKGGKTLLRDYSFLVYPRLVSGSIYTGNLDKFADAKLTEAPVIDISSTFIRESIADGKDMRPFLPPGVYDYIIKNNIYTSKQEPR
jgi:nicotinate-nucleotide adenylyltransferase